MEDRVCASAAFGVLMAGAILVLSGSVVLSSPAPEGADLPPCPPLGLPPVQWPSDNRYSRDKADLGRLLFFDRRLSSDGTVSCATCHAPEKAFTDGSPVATGIRGNKGTRSVPTLLNRAYGMEQFWDGRAASLEEQAKGPIANPLEMTSEPQAPGALEACVLRLRAIPGYAQLFRKVFGTADFTIDHVARALATFERTLYSANSPFDRYKAGDAKAMTAAQLRGMELFYNQAGCSSCHMGFNLTDGSYVNIGIGMDRPVPDQGRFGVTHRPEDMGAFKVPTLREVEHTRPYMHDGRYKTLEEVVEHYNRGGIPNPNLDRRLRPLHLTAEQKKDLVAFLKALSGEGWQNVTSPAQFPQ